MRSFRGRAISWRLLLAGMLTRGPRAGPGRGVLEWKRRATEAGTPTHHSVSAQVCQLETPSGLIRVTTEAATLPAAAASTDLQPAIALQCSDSESDDDEVTDAPAVTSRGYNRRTAL